MSKGQAWADALQAAANASEAFAAQSRWLDLRLLIRFGSAAYWFKIYRGKIIEAAPYNPVTNMLGWQVVIAGEAAAWRASLEGVGRFGVLSTTGQITGDGDRVEVERCHAAVQVLGSQVIPGCGLPSDMEG